MTFKYFTASIIFQSLMLGAVPLIGLMLWLQQQPVMLFYLLGGIYTFQVARLIFTVRKTNRELAKFIESFGFGDTTIHFRTNDKDASFKDLFKAFNQVVEAFRQLKLDKEKEYLFFENALKKLGVAIIVVNEHGNVLMSNDALLRLLDFKYIHRLDKLNTLKPGLANELMRLQPNQQHLVELMVNNRLLQVALTSVLMKDETKVLRLIAFQDIRSEIEQKELESWQKLIRVLTHEVINSLSPVNLISAGLKQRFDNGKQPLVIETDEQQEIMEALDAMHNRSKGLTQFVESYRSMTGLKSAQTSDCNIRPLLTRIQTLFAASANEANCLISVECHPGLSYPLDEKLIEQVLINLIKNSMEALDKTSSSIIVSAEKESKKLRLTVSDNGKGIPQNEINKVCVPFYTTRQGGNGIGLALSRQVMRLHGGQLKIDSYEGTGTRVDLIF